MKSLEDVAIVASFTVVVFVLLIPYVVIYCNGFASFTVLSFFSFFVLQRKLRIGQLVSRNIET